MDRKGGAVGNTKGQEAAEQEIKSAIMDARDRGVCDKEGRTIVRESDGRKAEALRRFRESVYWDEAGIFTRRCKCSS